MNNAKNIIFFRDPGSFRPACIINYERNSYKTVPGINTYKLALVFPVRIIVFLLHHLISN
jgi:hypothetical protein